MLLLVTTALLFGTEVVFEELFHDLVQASVDGRVIFDVDSGPHLLVFHVDGEDFRGDPLD